ncbi:hypothetical protein D3C84_1133920 [compost metagenome]
MAGREHGELTAAATRGQPMAAVGLVEQALEQLGDGRQQRVGALAAPALVEADEVIDPQHDQVALGILLGNAQ